MIARYNKISNFCDIDVAATEAYFLDSSTGWKPRKDTRVRQHNQVTHNSENPIFQTDSIQDDELFEEARREYIQEFRSKK